MGLSHDPMESIANAVKDSVLPLELNLRKVAKDLETHWRFSRRMIRTNLEKFSAPNGSVPFCLVKRKSYDSDSDGDATGNYGGCVASEGSKNGLLIWLSRKAFFGVFSSSAGNGDSGDEMLVRISNVKDSHSVNGVEAGAAWSMVVDWFAQEFPGLLKTGKMKSEMTGDEDEPVFLDSYASKLKPSVLYEVKNAGGNCQQLDEDITRKGKHVSCKSPMAFFFEDLAGNIQKFYPFARESAYGGRDCSDESSESSILFPNDHPKTVSSSLNTQNADLIGFARIRTFPYRTVGETSSIHDGTNDSVSAANEDGSGVSVDSPKKLLGCSSTTHPNKEKLYSVQDFFRYTEIEGRRFFEELDRDNDGRVTLEDLEIAMVNRELPKRYAKDLMNQTRSHLFSGSFGWKQFQSFMERKEPTILEAYMCLCLSKSRTLQRSEILASLKDTGMLSNNENTAAVVRFLTVDAAEPVSYVHFRNFMLLLPSEQLKIDNQSKWSKTASAAPVASSSQLDAGSLLKSALAGGISCAFSAFLMHPVDTVKTQVQASCTLSFMEILSKIPEIGAQGLYKGSIPAVAGQFASHGLRTSIYEASRLALAHIAPTLPDIQVQSVASFIGTFLGTAMRIPSEVLKQRLQANMFDNVVEATAATWHQDGLRGFFRGTGVTLLREVPFYVAGMGLYNESKKAVEQRLGRELEPWETIIVGALSGGFTAVLTTPFDVIKTRMMTAPQDVHVSFWMAAYSILKESPLAFYKGVVPRFFWTAPLGALNLAGCELLRKALDDTP